MSPATEGREWTLRLPYEKPPLSLNHRAGWQVRWKAEQEVKHAVGWVARSVRVPPMAACTVQLHYRPRTVRRRDTDNLVALLKPVCDGLVAVGVVADDTPEFMSKPEPVIHAADRVTYGLWVVITGGLS